MGTWCTRRRFLTAVGGDASYLALASMVGCGRPERSSESGGFPPTFSHLDGTYRAFRFPWSGYPSDRPAAVAERDSEEAVRVYASWNGATEVDAWEVLVGPRASRLVSLGSVPRDGFETAMTVRTTEPFVAVPAKDASGRILGASKPVESKTRNQ